MQSGRFARLYAHIANLSAAFSKRLTHFDTFRQAGKGVVWALPRAKRQNRPIAFT